MYLSLIILVFINFILLTNASLTFANPIRGFSSSAELRSASMPRKFNNNNNPQMVATGSGASPYRREIYHAPYNTNPYFIPPPSAPQGLQTQPFGHFGHSNSGVNPASSLASVLGIAAPPMIRKPCPISPFAKFLSKDEQEVLHELILEARRAGASEDEVKQYSKKYVKQILPPEKFQSFQSENNDFERRLSLFHRRGKRNAEIPRRFDAVTFRNRKTKKLPQKVEVANKNEFYDFIEVPKDVRSVDNLIELQ